MYIKTVSSITAGYAALGILLGWIYPESFLTAMISIVTVSIIIKLALVYLTLLVSRKKRLKYRQSRIVLGVTGVSLIAFGCICAFDLNLGALVQPYLLSFDFMLLMEIGILMLLTSITIKHRTAKLPKLAIYRLLLETQHKAIPAKS